MVMLPGDLACHHDSRHLQYYCADQLQPRSAKLDIAAEHTCFDGSETLSAYWYRCSKEEVIILCCNSLVVRSVIEPCCLNVPGPARRISPIAYIFNNACQACRIWRYAGTPDSLRGSSRGTTALSSPSLFVQVWPPRYPRSVRANVSVLGSGRTASSYIRLSLTSCRSEYRPHSVARIAASYVLRSVRIFLSADYIFHVETM